MTILIASSFGALGEIVLALPVLFVSLVAGLFAALFRLRWLSLGAGALCLLTAALLFFQDQSWKDSYERHARAGVDTREAEQAHADLHFLKMCALGLGLLVSAGALLPRDDTRQPPPASGATPS